MGECRRIDHAVAEARFAPGKVPGLCGPFLVPGDEPAVDVHRLARHERRALEVDDGADHVLHLTDASQRVVVAEPVVGRQGRAAGS